MKNSGSYRNSDFDSFRAKWAFQTCPGYSVDDNQNVSKGNNKYSTVGKNFEIDQAAIKIFDSWLPNHWLLRKQMPDVFVDYLVEIVEDGEPTGLHFAAQIKGYKNAVGGQKPLKHKFKTKHLKYYLHRSQHPVVLFLINVTTKEGYWLFAQKFLKENISKKTLEEQETETIHFALDDSLFNLVKFKSLLPEAERFVRDLHPGSPQAAIQKRKMDLETRDSRCSVEVDIVGGKEQVVIRPKESFSFSMHINSKNIDGWKAFVEKGEMIKTTAGEISFVGIPLFQDVLNQSDEIVLQIAGKLPASVNIINSNDGFPTVTHIDGTFTTGTKFSRFHGALPNSPLAVFFELSREDLGTRRSVELSVEFSLSKWAGQPVLNLAAFDQIKTFTESFSGQNNPKIEIFVDGISRVRGELGRKGTPIFDFINKSLEWLIKCRWLAEHFKVNPLLPKLDVFSQEEFTSIQELHDILKFRKMVFPKSWLELSIEIDSILDQTITRADTAKSLRLQSLKYPYIFFGTSISLPPIEHVFSEVNLFIRIENRGRFDQKELAQLVQAGIDRFARQPL